MNDDQKYQEFWVSPADSQKRLNNFTKFYSVSDFSTAADWGMIPILPQVRVIYPKLSRFMP